MLLSGANTGNENRPWALRMLVATMPIPYITICGRKNHRNMVPSRIWSARTAGSCTPENSPRASSGAAIAPMAANPASVTQVSPSTEPATCSASASSPRSRRPTRLGMSTACRTPAAISSNSRFGTVLVDS